MRRVADFVWMRQAIPWLGRGFVFCVHEDARDALQTDLERTGFAIVVIDGERMTDAATFHEEAARAFGFPDYYGRNWDAFDECFGEVAFAHPTAILWRSAERLAATDLKTFAEAIAQFRYFHDVFATPDRDDASVGGTQLELVLIGRGPSFRRPSDPLEPGWAL